MYPWGFCFSALLCPFWDVCFCDGDLRNCFHHLIPVNSRLGIPSVVLQYLGIAMPFNRLINLADGKGLSRINLLYHYDFE